MIKKLRELKQNRKNYEDVKKILKEKEEIFQKENSEMIKLINFYKIRIPEIEASVKEEGIKLYKETGNKKLEGGVGIRITKKLVYDEKKALDWAKEHQIALQLNKKEFESIAKNSTENIDFVEKKEAPQATIPSKIEI